MHFGAILRIGCDNGITGFELDFAIAENCVSEQQSKGRSWKLGGWNQMIAFGWVLLVLERGSRDEQVA